MLNPAPIVVAMRPSSIRQRGATLLEVLVAVLIFSFGLLGLVGLQTRAMQYSGNAEDRVRASTLAAEMAAQVYTLRSSSNLTSTTGWTALKTAWDSKLADPATGLPGGTGTLTETVATATTPAFVTIKIEWQPLNSATKSQHVTDVLTSPPVVPPPVVTPAP